jgi:hypothetical protein
MGEGESRIVGVKGGDIGMSFNVDRDSQPANQAGRFSVSCVSSRPRLSHYRPLTPVVASVLA